MENNYLVVKTEYSNGLPYNEIVKDTLTKSDAQVYMQIVLKEALMEYPEECGFDAVKKTDTEYFCTNSQGNGLGVRVLNAQEMVLAIQKAVDNSEQKTTLKHYGKTEYEIEIPKLDLMFDNGDSKCSRYVDEDGIFEPFSLLRRPYDDENKDDTEYIYEVYSTFYEDKNCKDGIISTQFLDEIPLEMLIDIYDNI